MTLLASQTNRLMKRLGEDTEGTLHKLDELQELLLHLRYEGKHLLGKNLKRGEEVSSFFEGELSRHMALEEEVLFPFLKNHLPRLEPLILLLTSEHEEFKRCLRTFRFWLKELSQNKNPLSQGRILEEVKESGTYLTYLLESHLQEESGILYRVADEELRPGEKRELVRQAKQHKRKEG